MCPNTSFTIKPKSFTNPHLFVTHATYPIMIISIVKTVLTVIIFIPYWKSHMIHALIVWITRMHFFENWNMFKNQGIKKSQAPNLAFFIRPIHSYYAA